MKVTDPDSLPMAPPRFHQEPYFYHILYHIRLDGCPIAPVLGAGFVAGRTGPEVRQPQPTYAIMHLPFPEESPEAEDGRFASWDEQALRATACVKPP